MVRGINYSVRQMFPLTDGAGYKLFGANIYPHPPWWGFLLRRNMNIQSGFFYHIKDAFFEEVQDNSLMANIFLHQMIDAVNICIEKRNAAFVQTDIIA